MKDAIGNFLLRRLDEAGIRHLFGVAGDYNVEFTQQLEDRPVQVPNRRDERSRKGRHGGPLLKHQRPGLPLR